MRVVILSILLSISTVSTAIAVEADFKTKIASVLSTDNPDPERVKIIAVADFSDAEFLVNRALIGKPINTQFTIQKMVGQPGVPNIVYDQTNDIVFAAGQTKVVIGKLANGRIVAQYDAVEVTFNIRFALDSPQDGSTGTGIRDTFLVNASIEGENNTVFSVQSQASAGFITD